MGRTLKYDIPGEDLRVTPAQVAEVGWESCFAGLPPEAFDPADGRLARLVLEIGFGRGEFLLDLAAREPETAFVGVEISFKRTLKMARKLARSGLRNVRLIEARAEVVLRELFQPGRLSAIWINFSDPWPKARHAHRRLIQPALVADAAARLAPGGTLYVATDDVSYAHQIDEVLAGESALRNVYAPWPFVGEVPGRMRTGYEEQWRAEGRPLHFFAYTPVAAREAVPGEGAARSRDLAASISARVGAAGGS